MFVRITYVWITLLLTTFVFTISWFGAYAAVVKLIDTVESQWGTSENQPCFTLARTVWHGLPALMFFGLLLWAYVYSQKREWESYVR